MKISQNLLLKNKKYIDNTLVCIGSHDILLDMLPMLNIHTSPIVLSTCVQINCLFMPFTFTKIYNFENVLIIIELIY